MTYYLLFIFILDKGKDVRQKANLSDFSIEFKMGHKQHVMETTCNINNTLGLGTANKHTLQWWFKKFCRANESLEDERAQWPATGSWQWPIERIIKIDSLTTHKKLPKNSMSTILWSFRIWSKLERWKSLISGCLLSWPKRKIGILKCHLLLLLVATMNRFLIGLWHVMKSGFYMKISND